MNAPSKLAHCSAVNSLDQSKRANLLTRLTPARLDAPRPGAAPL